MKRIGDMVWWFECHSARGPLPAVVLQVRGDVLDLHVFGAGPGVALSVRPLGADNNSGARWMDIPADGVVPPDLFD
jgi:hypothetical protein